MLAVPLLHRALSICECAAPSRLPLAACSDPDSLPLVSIVCFLTHRVPECPGTGNEGLFIRLRSSLDRGLRSRLGSAVSCERRFRPVALCFVGVASLSPWFYCPPLCVSRSVAYPLWFRASNLFLPVVLPALGPQRRLFVCVRTSWRIALESGTRCK